MTGIRTFTLRPWLAAALVLALLVAGMGRGWAAASAVPETLPAIPGAVVHLCHADGGDRDTGDPVGHDCCDLCALCAPVTLAAPPGLPTPTPVVHVTSHAADLEWSPVLVRPRTPRLDQGPPIA